MSTTQIFPLPTRSSFTLSEVLARYRDDPYQPGDSLSEFTPFWHTVSSARSHGYLFATTKDARGRLVEDGPATRQRNEAYRVSLVTSDPERRTNYDKRPGENRPTSVDVEVVGSGSDGEIKTWRFPGDEAWLLGACGAYGGCTLAALWEAYLVMEDAGRSAATDA